MPKEKGNELVAKSKGGRPVAFTSPEQLMDLVDNYIAECEEKGEPILMVGFAKHIKVHKDTLQEYSKKDGYSVPLKLLKQEAEHSLIKGALLGTYSASFSQFLAKNNHGYKDKSEADISVSTVKSFADFYSDVD
jgi:hypothetical protein